MCIQQLYLYIFRGKNVVWGLAVSISFERRTARNIKINPYILVMKVYRYRDYKQTKLSFSSCRRLLLLLYKKRKNKLGLVHETSVLSFAPLNSGHDSVEMKKQNSLKKNP